MWNRRFDWLPIAIFLVFAVNFTTVYVISVSLQHVPAFLPYISEAGGNTPESGIFGVLLNLCAFMLLLTMYIRYRHYMHHVPRHNKCARRVMYLAVVCAVLSSLGISMVGCFPVGDTSKPLRPEVIIPHLIGATLAFMIGTVFIWIDAGISLYMLKKHYCDHASMRVCITRFVLCTIAIICYVSMSVSGNIAKTKENSNLPIVSGVEVVADDPISPTAPRSAARIVSAASEWVLAVALLSYFLSLMVEFRVFSLSKPQVIRLRSNEDGRVSPMTSREPVTITYSSQNAATQYGHF